MGTAAATVAANTYDDKEHTGPKIPCLTNERERGGATIVTMTAITTTMKTGHDDISYDKICSMGVRMNRVARRTPSREKVVAIAADQRKDGVMMLVF